MVELSYTQMLVTQHEVSSDWYKNFFLGGGGEKGENKVFGIAPFYYNWRSPKGDSLKKET